MTSEIELMTAEQLNRYNRHLILDGVGMEGQQRLLSSRVLIVGAGGLGSAVALYLAAAGVGVLGIADGDTVSLSNLQRQIIHRSCDISLPKVDSAERAIRALNPDVRVEKHAMFLHEENVRSIVRLYDFVVDATDNFQIKYLINDSCLAEAKPFCMGGIQHFTGQLMTHIPGTACYRCLFPEPPVNTSTDEAPRVIGVLGSIAGICGTLQATEVIKFLTGVGDLLTNALLTFDALSMQFSRFEFQKSPDCPLCSSPPQTGVQ